MKRLGGIILGLLVLSFDTQPLYALESSARPIARSSIAGSGARAIPQSESDLDLSPRPGRRPDNLVRKSNVRAAGFKPANPLRNLFGSRRKVCGETGIQGEATPAIPARLKGCGLSNGVKVTAVQGVALSTPVTIDCPTARALNTWVQTGVKPAVGQRGGGVVEIKVVAHYICRTRNNQPGARISEHGRGKALDIAGFSLKNGAQISVLTGWKDPAQGPILKSMHKAACGPFGTVLGPNANRFHRDHFHFDTASYRSGAYCK